MKNKDSGYDKLQDFLEKLSEELLQKNEPTYSNDVKRAILFRYSSGTEYLGESRIILNKILEDNIQLSADTIEEIQKTLILIDIGFKKIGG